MPEFNKSWVSSRLGHSSELDGSRCSETWELLVFMCVKHPEKSLRQLLTADKETSDSWRANVCQLTKILLTAEEGIACTGIRTSEDVALYGEERIFAPWRTYLQALKRSASPKGWRLRNNVEQERIFSRASFISLDAKGQGSPSSSTIICTCFGVNERRPAPSLLPKKVSRSRGFLLVASVHKGRANHHPRLQFLPKVNKGK